MRLQKVLVPMTDEERAALVKAAQQSMREPQQQARFILRKALLGDLAPTDNKSTGAQTWQGETGAFVGVNP